MLKVVSITLLLFFSLTNAHAIKISTENTGQLLLAPIYLAQDSMITRLTIVNTRIDAAVVARLVLRDYKVSSKLWTMNLYLSPGDVWTGALYGGANQVKLYSADDSTLKDNLQFATPKAPLNVDISHGSADSGVNNIGHIEIIGLGSIQAGHRYCASNGKLNPAKGETQCDTVKVKQGMSKDDLFKLYSYAADVSSLKADKDGNLIYKDIDSDGGGVSMVQPEKLQITGMAEVSIPSGPAFTYNMIALEPTQYNWGNLGIDIKAGWPRPRTGANACTTTVPYSCFPNYVITNPLFASSQAQEAGIGVNYGSTDSNLSFEGDTSDHVISIEALFAKTEIKHTYIKNKTILITTFPTKYRHFDSTGNGVCKKFYGQTDSGDKKDNLYTSPFFWDKKGSLYYDLTSFDQQENSIYVPGPIIPVAPDFSFSGGVNPDIPPVPPNNQTIEPELWITTLDKFYGFDEGWAILKYIYKEGCGYQGVPAISYTLKVKDKNLLLEKTF